MTEDERAEISYLAGVWYAERAPGEPKAPKSDIYGYPVGRYETSNTINTAPGGVEKLTSFPVPEITHDAHLRLLHQEINELRLKLAEARVEIDALKAKAPKPTVHGGIPLNALRYGVVGGGGVGI